MKSRQPRSLVQQLFRTVVLLTVGSLLLVTGQGYLAGEELLRDAVSQNLVLERAVSHLHLRLFVSAAASLAAALALAAWLSSRLSRQLASLRQGADRMAAGEPDYALPSQDHPQELALLGDSIQRLARSLAHQIQTEEDRRNELDALLAGLRDGVLTLDRNGRVQACNPAARRLLGLDDHPVGARLADLLAPQDLLEMVEATWSEGESERELRLQQGPPRELRAHTLPLPAHAGPEGERLLVVLTDVSSVNQVERLRRDFVSNVSHELKTPVTSIRGYAEMLKDGGLDAETGTRFLDVIERQARRLDAIIDDLLDLSRLERQREDLLPELVPVPLFPLLNELLEDHLVLAQAAQVELRLEIAPGTPDEALSQSSLLQRALANLLGNAIRYGRPQSTVWLKARRDRRHPRYLLLEVQDQGRGIAAEHLPRLFERFYVVDKARSRALGGTGLGLAIVKHVAALLQGEVGVFSLEGEGSTFWLRIPAGGS